MIVTRDLSKKIAPDLTLALAQTIEHELARPSRKRIVRYHLTKPAAYELHDELKALWKLYHNAQRLAQWVRNFGHRLPRGDLARKAIASELRSTRYELAQIRESRKGA